MTASLTASTTKLDYKWENLCGRKRRNRNVIQAIQAKKQRIKAIYLLQIPDSPPDKER